MIMKDREQIYQGLAIHWKCSFLRTHSDLTRNSIKGVGISAQQLQVGIATQTDDIHILQHDFSLCVHA